MSLDKSEQKVCKFTTNATKKINYTIRVNIHLPT